MRHTPGPWSRSGTYGTGVFTDTKETNVIAMCHIKNSNRFFEAKANAAFIVTACNNHRALLEACEMALRVLLQTGNGEDYVDRTINDLEAALTAAKGE